MDDRKDNDKETQECGGRNEDEKRSIIAFADTVVEPDTMMIFDLYTVVALPAMTGAWRSIYPTGFAVLQRPGAVLDLDLFWHREALVLP